MREEPENPIEKGDAPDTETTDLYKSAITESIQSIFEDETLSADEKRNMIEKSLEQYHAAMIELAKGKCRKQEDLPDPEEDEEEEEKIPDPEEDLDDEDRDPDYEDIEEVENPVKKK